MAERVRVRVRKKKKSKRKIIFKRILLLLTLVLLVAAGLADTKYTKRSMRQIMHMMPFPAETNQNFGIKSSI